MTPLESDLVERWLTECYVNRDASPQTVTLRRDHLRRLAAHHDENLLDLDAETLTAWVHRPGIAANTRICALSGARSFYQWARKRGHITVDPTEDIPKPRTPQPRPRPVPNDLYQRLLSETTHDLRLRVAIRLAGELGLRRGEVAGLHRDHLIEDEDGHWLRFVGKGNKERIIPCPNDIATEVLGLLDATPGDYAFPTPMIGRSLSRLDRHMTPHWLGTLVSRALPDGYTMHKLRHRAGTEAYRRSGNDIYLASKLLGHSSVTTTQVYVKPDMARLRAVVSGGEA